MGISSWDEIRQDMISETPEQWCSQLSVLESRMGNHGFNNLKDLITTSYSKGGLGVPLEKAIQLIDFNPAYKHQAVEFKKKLGLAELAKDVPVLGEVGGDRKSNQADKNENVSLKHGNSAEYRVSKLKRDHPEIAQRLIDGEFKSVSAAERAAGMPDTRTSPVEKAIKAFSKLSDEDKETFIESVFDDFN